MQYFEPVCCLVLFMNNLVNQNHGIIGVGYVILSAGVYLWMPCDLMLVNLCKSGLVIAQEIILFAYTAHNELF